MAKRKIHLDLTPPVYTKDETEYTPIHLHSGYSTYDGVAPIKEMVECAVSLGMSALSISDHGNMSGVFSFNNECKANNIKPVIGCEFYVNPEREPEHKNTRNQHLCLFAMNEVGYKNLLKITYDANLNGFYYRPRTNLEFVARHSEGLICTTACIVSPILLPWVFGEGDIEVGVDNLMLLREAFEDRLYLELQFNEIPEQHNANNFILNMADEFNLNLIYGLDAHYAYPQDVHVQDALILNNRKITKNDPGWQEKIFDTRELFIKPYQVALDAPEHFGFDIDSKIIEQALEATNELAYRCNFEIQTGIHPPVYLEDGEPVDENKYLQEQLNKDFDIKLSSGRIPKDKEAEYRARMKHEFDTISQMRYSNYFLIIWDMVRAAKSNGIFLGAGRGSGAGCLVSFILGISEIDPVKYELLFERFMTPDRQDPPDIDLDWESGRGDEVEDYLRGKYGDEYVSHVVSFSHWQPKNTVGEIFKTMGETVQDTRKLTKLIREAEGGGHDSRSIDEVVDIARESNDFAVKNMIDRQEFMGIEIAKRLVGGIKNITKHAAGVVISPKPIFDYIPVIRRKDEILTGFAQGGDGQSELEEIGLIKIDNLKVQSISVIKDTVALIKERHGKDIDVWQLEPDDPKVFEYYCKGLTEGIFQLETDQATNFIIKMKPNCFDDVQAMVALYRPGTLSSGEADRFVKIKNGEEERSSIHPSLDEILEPTYGCVVYQEQIMRIMNQLAGIPASKTFNNFKLLKKIYKSSGTRVEAIAAEFQQGLEKVSGFTEEQSTELMITLKKAFEYIFNKSHATAYGFTSYITMWLKVHYPLEFFVSLLNWEKNEEKKGKYSRVELRVKKYIEGAGKLGIKVLPPEFGKSKQDYVIEDENIRAGIKILVGLGESGNQLELVDGLMFEDVISSEDVSFQKLNKKKIEILLDAGFFDGKMSKDLNRRQSMFAWEVFKEKTDKKKLTVKQKKLIWDDCCDVAIEECNSDEFTESQILIKEKKYFRFFFNSHPMQEKTIRDGISQYNEDYINRMKPIKPKKVMLLETTSTCNAVSRMRHTMVGYVTEASVVKTKKGRNPGQQMAIVMLEDGLAESKLLVWPAYFTLYSEMLKEGNVLAIRVEKMKGEKNTYQLCDIKAFRGKSQMIELHELIGE